MLESSLRYLRYMPAGGRERIKPALSLAIPSVFSSTAGRPSTCQPPRRSPSWPLPPVPWQQQFPPPVPLRGGVSLQVYVRFIPRPTPADVRHQLMLDQNAAGSGCNAAASGAQELSFNVAISANRNCLPFSYFGVDFDVKRAEAAGYLGIILAMWCS